MKDNKKSNDNDVKISHRNVLWFIYRMLAERMNLPTKEEKNKL